VPGPVADGRGGREPTTTDANLLLGRIDPQSFAGGELTPDWDAVKRAFAALGAKLGVSAADAARGVVRIANANMTNALRLISTNKGYDPRDFALMAFGGGGPMHAAALARELKVPRVIVPVNSAVFSAWGMLLTDLRRDLLQTHLMPLCASSAPALAAQFKSMESTAAAEFQRDGIPIGEGDLHYEYLLDMRYQGQEHTVKVPIAALSMPLDVDQVADVFHAAYEKRYTYRLPNAMQVVNFHLVARVAVPKPELPKVVASGRALAGSVLGRRRVDFDIDGVADAVIYDGTLLEPGMTFEGPAVIQEPVVTLVVPPGDSVTIDDYGSYHIRLKL
jgi:N-methylhydantoinase A